jgi:acyl carrier protein
MNDNAEIYTRLQGIFDNVFMEEVRVTPQLAAKDVDEWDSLTHVSLVLAIEEQFKIRFRVGEVESAKNVGDLVNLIALRTK